LKQAKVRIVRGAKCMKYLKIENNQGFFLKEDNWIAVDQITKEDLFSFINIILDSVEGEFEMDEFSEETIQHAAHKIIYKNIYNKLLELEHEKDNLHDKVNQQFSTAFQKYSND
jgi:hypothetical protein